MNDVLLWLLAVVSAFLLGYSVQGIVCTRQRIKDNKEMQDSLRKARDFFQFKERP